MLPQLNFNTKLTSYNVKLKVIRWKLLYYSGEMLHDSQITSNAFSIAFFRIFCHFQLFGQVEWTYFVFSAMDVISAAYCLYFFLCHIMYALLMERNPVSWVLNSPEFSILLKWPAWSIIWIMEPLILVCINIRWSNLIFFPYHDAGLFTLRVVIVYWSCQGGKVPKRAGVVM